MAPKTNLTMKGDIQIAAREVDFVTRFTRNWEHLREILGIMRPIKKQPGTVLKSKTASVTLAATVGEGEEIPYSKATVIEKDYASIDVEKYAKAVSIEAIKEYGYDAAVQMTDDAFLFELQSNVTNRFYSYLNTGLFRNAIQRKTARLRQPVNCCTFPGLPAFVGHRGNKVPGLWRT